RCRSKSSALSTPWRSSRQGARSATVWLAATLRAWALAETEGYRPDARREWLSSKSRVALVWGAWNRQERSQTEALPRLALAGAHARRGRHSSSVSITLGTQYHSSFTRSIA